MKYAAVLSLTVMMYACADQPSSQPATDSVVDSIETKLITESEWKIFPIPNLDSLLKFYETSGAVCRSPSDVYFNPSDTGIFVSYMLFDKTTEPLWTCVGWAITHTYMKPRYGWSNTDTDQVFISLWLDRDIYSIGEIGVGAKMDELQLRLGTPVYSIDSSFVFLGSNKIVGKFTLKDGLVQSFNYTRFDLPDSVFVIDSSSRQKMIEQKWEKAKY